MLRACLPACLRCPLCCLPYFTLPACCATLCRCPLQDWNNGRIPYFTLPPKRQTEVEGSAQLVAAWGADFDVDQVGGWAAPVSTPFGSPV